MMKFSFSNQQKIGLTHWLFLIISSMIFFSCHFKDKKSSSTASPDQREKPPITPPDSKEEAPLVALSDSAYLRKLSLHLRGIPPSPLEYRALQEAQKNKNVTAHFQAVIKSFLNSPYHVEKMNHRLNEYFKLRTDTYFATPDWPVLKEELEQEEAGNYSYVSYLRSDLHRNSINDLFRSLVRENQSWDQLLLKKSYRIYIPENPDKNRFIFGKMVERNFYYPLAKDQLPLSRRGWVDIHFGAEDPRIAGALTTTRFFDRYPNTAVNKNRKRAATIFRMFLCDSMNTVALEGAQDESQIFKMVFPQKSNASLNAVAANPNDPHGSDPACFKCHYKLDPAGATFEASHLSLSPFASPGALVFKRSETEKVNIPVEGLGVLGRKITEQPEYVRCQTQLFWDWFIGNDIPLSSGQVIEAQQNFEKVGRRVNDFVEYLVSMPHFTSRAQLPSENEIETKVKLIFKRCDSCHKEEEDIPLFAEWPIGGSEAKMKTYLRKITKQLDLKGDGKAAIMPPADSNWRLSAQERSVLQIWVQQKTESTVIPVSSVATAAPSSTAATMALMPSPSATAFLSSSASPSFDRDFTSFSYQNKSWLSLSVGSNASSNFNKNIHSQPSRYIAGADLILTLANKFPFWKIKDTAGVESTSLPFDCRLIYGDIVDKLGVASPRTGSPMQDHPSPSMARWYYECGQLYINADFKESVKTLQLNHYFSTEVQEQFQLREPEHLHIFLAQRWNTLNPELQTQLFSYWIEYLLGPEELLGDLTQGQFTTTRELAIALIQQIPEKGSQLTLQELIPQLNLLLIMQDAFLQY